MAQNASVQKFKALTDELQKEIHQSSVDELHKQAEGLMETIKSVTPVYQGLVEGPSVHPGALKDSVRLVQGNKDTIVRIVAGGQSTTHASATGVPYDYARAEEFGTQKNRAHPFFFPTYRLTKPKIIAAMKRRIRDNIRKYSAEQ